MNVPDAGSPSVPETSVPPGILIADGDPAVRKLLRTALGTKGFAIWESADGGQACRLLEKNRGKIAAALIDLHLPEGGLATVEALRHISPRLRYCLMTASVAGDGYTNEQLLAANVAIVFKPFKVSQLLELIKQLTGTAA